MAIKDVPIVVYCANKKCDASEKLIDLNLAGESKVYCDEFKGRINGYGLEITELSTHLQENK